MEKFLEGLAAVVAGDGFMQVPPNAFDGIRLRRVFGQVMQDEPTGVTFQTGTHRPAIMETSVVADDVDNPVATQSATQIVEMSDEQSGVALPTWRRQEQPAGSPVQRAGNMCFLVVAGGADLGLFATKHPA